MSQEENMKKEPQTSKSRIKLSYWYTILIKTLYTICTEEMKHENVCQQFFNIRNNCLTNNVVKEIIIINK